MEIHYFLVGLRLNEATHLSQSLLQARCQLWHERSPLSLGPGFRSQFAEEAEINFGTCQLSSVQNPSIIPKKKGWFIGIPLLDYYTRIPNILGSIIPHNHQPTGVLNTAQ